MKLGVLMDDKRLLRLVKKARSGDKDAFCDLVNLKGKSIVYIATNLMGNKADGEDAAQEAVIALGRNIGKLKKAELFDAWMYRIIFNVCMDAKRKKAKVTESSVELEAAADLIPEKSKEVLPEEMLQDGETKEEVMAAINGLPERYRLFVLLHYYEDKSYAEIASMMQVSEQVVANTLNRARQKMRESFVRDNPEKEYTAYKTGALFSAVAISQALASDAQATVLPGAVSGIVAVASAVPLTKASFLLRFFDSPGAQAAAGAACVLALALGFLAWPKPEIEEVAPAPQAVYDVSSVESTDIEGLPRIVSVEGIPEGSRVTVLTEGVYDEEIAAFDAAIGDYQYVTETDKEGYHYVLYQNVEDAFDYVVISQRIAE